MNNTIKLSNNLISNAKIHSTIYHRSIPKQIEFWAIIGKIAEDNPDLTYEMIKDILLSMEENKQGLIEEYKFN